MTTTVKIEAHCSDTVEVVIAVKDEDFAEEFVLQDGESDELCVYDDRLVTVKERSK